MTQKVITTVYEDPETGLTVGTYTGKERRDGGERKRVHVSRRDDRGCALFATFSKEEYLALAEFIGQEQAIYPEG